MSSNEINPASDLLEPHENDEIEQCDVWNYLFASQEITEYINSFDFDYILNFKQDALQFLLRSKTFKFTIYFRILIFWKTIQIFPVSFFNNVVIHFESEKYMEFNIETLSFYIQDPMNLYVFTHSILSNFIFSHWDDLSCKIQLIFGENIAVSLYYWLLEDYKIFDYLINYYLEYLQYCIEDDSKIFKHLVELHEITSKQDDNQIDDTLINTIKDKIKENGEMLKQKIDSQIQALASKSITIKEYEINDELENLVGFTIIKEITDLNTDEITDLNTDETFQNE